MAGTLQDKQADDYLGNKSFDAMLVKTSLLDSAVHCDTWCRRTSGMQHNQVFVTTFLQLHCCLAYKNHCSWRQALQAENSVRMYSCFLKLLLQMLACRESTVPYCAGCTGRALQAACAGLENHHWHLAATTHLTFSQFHPCFCKVSVVYNVHC